MKMKTKFVNSRPRLVEAVTALGAALEKKVGARSDLGPKAEPGNRSCSSSAASSCNRSHTLAAHHTRQGVAISKGSMCTVHQMVPRGDLKGR